MPTGSRPLRTRGEKQVAADFVEAMGQYRRHKLAVEPACPYQNTAEEFAAEVVTVRYVDPNYGKGEVSTKTWAFEVH